MTDHADLGPVPAAWLKAIAAWDAQIAELTAKRARAIEIVKETLGDATEARIDGKPVATWAWSKPGQRLDRKKLEGDYGADVIAAYLIDNAPARPFKILAGDE